MDISAPIALERKQQDPTGLFEGYASIFDVVDDGRDVIRPGAFTRSLRGQGPGGVKLLWQHDPTDPVGQILDAREDGHGLLIRGRILTDLRRGEEALALMRLGALDGLSIGFRARQADRDAASGIRTLIDVDLLEVSLVTFPMQRLARVHRLDPASHEPDPTAGPDDPETRGAAWDGVLADLHRLERAMLSFN